MAILRISVLCLSLMLAISLSQAAHGQFFTKPASKSIPRMGRSSQESMFASDEYRHFLINNLLDNYGPNLMEALLKEQEADKMKNNRLVYTYEGLDNPMTSSSETVRLVGGYDESGITGIGEEEVPKKPASQSMAQVLRQLAKSYS